MNIGKTDIISKIRTAIDDIAPAGTSDSFVNDVDDELWQAVQHAVVALSEELPIHLLNASVESLNGTVDSSRGFAYGELPDDYLRFVSIDITGTAGILNELIEPGSDIEKMQRSPWSRGTATKPKAMMDHDENGKKVIVWWPGNDTHDSAQLTYIAVPKETPAEDSDEETQGTETVAETSTTPEPPYIECSIRDEAERLVIYRAASIFFEGKKESEIAEKFRNLQ